MRQLEAQGVITRRVALLDREQLNLDLTVFIAVRTNQHTAEWLESFQAAVRDMPRDHRDLPHDRRDRLPAAGGGAQHEGL